MQLKPGHVAVITGAANGIGLALAELLVARGLHVVLGDLDGTALDAAAARLHQPDRPVTTVVTDVTDPDAVAALADTALRTHGVIHLACNNAGITGVGGPMWTLDDTAWHRAIDVNLWGVINGIRAFVPHLVAQDHGHVLNTASLAGLTTTPYTAPYNASKHAVVTITETLAAELSMRGSKVTTSVACPGFVNTAIWDAERERMAGLDGPAVDPSYAAFSAAITQMAASGGQNPADTATRIVDGVEAGRLHLFTHPEMAPLIHERIRLIEADL